MGGAPIYVDGDSDRFRYVLDWYRFGTLRIPAGMSVCEMRRECAFYGLPDDATIEHQDVGDAVDSLVSCRTKAKKNCCSAAVLAAAHAAFDQLLNDGALTVGGISRKSWGTSKPSDLKNFLVWSAVIDRAWSVGDCLQQVDSDFKGALTSLAEENGFAVKIREHRDDEKRVDCV